MDEVTIELEVTGVGAVAVRLTRQGSGPPVLVLHGGAGPASVSGLAAALAGGGFGTALVPTHPGFDGTPRPESLTTIDQLGAVYAALLAELDVEDVLVIGNSIGGWIAAELVLADAARVGRLVLVDAVGIAVPEHPVAGFFGLSLAEIADYSYFEPEKFRLDPATLSPERLAAMAGNRATLSTYGGEPSMADPGLRSRLAAIAVPTLVVWGEADRIVTPEYGRAYAEAIPGAGFTLMPRTGHLPQLESLPALLDVVQAFSNRDAPG